MAVTVNGFDNNPFDQRSLDAAGGRFIKALYRFVLSGSYTTNGDPLDFSNGGVNSAVPSAVSSLLPAFVDIQSNGPASSVGANGGNYQFVPGTTLANGKLKIFATAGTQYANGAYSTDATTDVIYAIVY